MHLLTLAVTCAAALFVPVRASHTTRGFASTVKVSGRKCQVAVSSLSRKVLACYSTALYYSTPTVVCDDHCFMPTIKGSRAIVNSCKGSPRSLATYGAYLNWADRTAAEAACATSSSDSTCLEFLVSAITVADRLKNNQQTDPTEDDLTNLGCSEDCAKGYYDAVGGEAGRAPTLYYYGNNKIPTLFWAWETYCQWDQQA
jgi:hypothetical protein